ncbi:hypothetical protein KIL84_005287 [Mauremys mutica]|uniref:Uncharacterized protein n=1 Tax=Mauremys mutica TaxID=74926 RepID=A0A9D4B5P4_9SAUR|nr:hypothetical protein KIL84_005287 [Mauremys mutica]
MRTHTGPRHIDRQRMSYNNIKRSFGAKVKRSGCSKTIILFNCAHDKAILVQIFIRKSGTSQRMGRWSDISLLFKILLKGILDDTTGNNWHLAHNGGALQVIAQR